MHRAKAMHIIFATFHWECTKSE